MTVIVIVGGGGDGVGGVIVINNFDYKITCLRLKLNHIHSLPKNKEVHSRNLYKPT